MGVEVPPGVPEALQGLEGRLRERFGEDIVEFSWHRGVPRVRIEPGALREVVGFLRDDPEVGCEFLRLISTVDRIAEGRIEVYYFLGSLEKPQHRVEVVVWLDREHPRVPSLVPLWRGANWQEREAYDLMGVVFEGHPDLRRILLPEVWEGHPLRKDYVYDADTMVAEILATFGYTPREVDTWEREEKSLPPFGGGQR